MRGGAALGGGDRGLIDWPSTLPKMWEALLTGVVAPGALLLGQWLFRRSQEPRLTIDTPSGAGWRVEDECETDTGERTRRLWLRLRVRNSGRKTALGCQVFLMQYGPPGRSLFAANAKEHDPAPLVWAHTEHLPVAQKLAVDLPPDVHRFADFLVAFDEPPTGKENINLRSTTRHLGFQDAATKTDGLSIDVLAIDAHGNSARAVLTFRWDGTLDGLHWRNTLIRIHPR